MKVRVENYQTSLDTEFEIKGFTVIVGKSNTGKTALLRAVEGALFNDPVTGKVREGTKNTRVSIDLPDIQFIWTKGDCPPKYEVTTEKGFEEYSSLGRKVPQEIIDAGFWEWRSDDLKARPQVAAWYEPIFLLNKTPKVITELLATVTRLDVVNLSIRKASLYIRRKRSTLQVREKDLQKSEARAREFDEIDSIDMATLEAAHSDWEVAQLDIGAVQEFQVRLSNLNDRLEQFEVLDEIGVLKPLPTGTLKDISQLTKWDKSYTSMTDTLSAFEVLDDVGVLKPLPTGTLKDISQLTKWDKSYTAMTGTLSAMEVLDDVAIPRIDLQGTADALKEVSRYITKLAELTANIGKLDKAEGILTTTIDTDVAHLGELRGSIDGCPVCGRDE